MTININSISLEIIDTIEKMTIADSFVARSNKIGGGNGEAKFYIGNENIETRTFFGEKGFRLNCFLLKKDLKEFLINSESEYKNPEQPYQKKDNLPALWQERMDKIEQLDEVLYFSLLEQTQIAGPRIYVKAIDNDPVYKLIREIALPNISYLSAIKLIDAHGNFIFYFKPFVDYFGEYENLFIVEEEIKILEEEEIPIEVKTQLIRARKGQGKYRQQLLEECPFCPITLISDDRLLIASHIKPWIKSDDNEKIDPKNGFMFTPTYDLLFDRGFISFTNDGKIVISPWLSKMTCSKLNISPEKQYPMLPTRGREHYLLYHRENIFKG
jgi:putative restriction endonuclease